MAVKVLRVEGMREDTRTPEERRALEAAEPQPLDMSVDARARRGPAADRARRLRADSDFTERLGLLLGEVEADDNVWKAHKATFVDQCIAGRGEPAADPALLVGAPRVARGDDRPARST